MVRRFIHIILRRCYVAENGRYREMRAKQELRPIVNDAPSTGARTRDATFQYNYADGFIGNWFMGVFIDDTRMLILGAEYRTVRCVCGYFHFHTHTHTENRHGPWVYGLWLWNDLFFWDRRLCGSIGHSAFGLTSYLISFKFPFASNIRWVAPCTAGRVFQSGFFFCVRFPTIDARMYLCATSFCKSPFQPGIYLNIPLTKRLSTLRGYRLHS